MLNPLIIFATIPADQYYYFIDSLRSSRLDTRNFVTCAEFLIQEISQRLDASDSLDIRMGLVSGISRFNAAGHRTAIISARAERSAHIGFRN